MNFADWFKEQLRLRGLSYRECAEAMTAVGVPTSTSTVGEYGRGYQTPNPERRVALAAVLEVPPDVVDTALRPVLALRPLPPRKVVFVPPPTVRGPRALTGIVARMRLWTEDEDATIRRLVGEGWRASAIAAELSGRTPAAVANRISRVGL